MIRCLSCGAETSNGLALCELCRRKALACLDVLPIYFRNLSRWRPGGSGGRRVPGSREPVSGPSSGDRITEAMDEAGNDLTTWARTLADDRPYIAKLLDRLNSADLDEVQVARWLCKGFERYLTSVSTLEWCGEFVRSMSHHEERLRALTEDVAPGWYAGGCHLCGLPTYVVPGLTWVTCGHCGVTTNASDHLDVILVEAREWIAPPKRIAEVVVALVDAELSVEDLRKRIAIWGTRERLVIHRSHGYAQKNYRFGEVLDALAAKRAS